MFKFVVVTFAIISCVAAKPGLLGASLSYTAPVAIIAVPAPVITATSSQVIARTYNRIATTPVVAPIAPVAPVAPEAPVADFPVLAKTIAAPIAAAQTAPIPAYRTHIVGKTFAAPPFAYTSHFAVASASVLW